MADLSIPHSIEKVVFRLGLQGSGHVTLAEIFVQLPFGFDLINEHVTELADGRTLLKDEVGEFSAIYFPEFTALQNNSASQRKSCPVCAANVPEFYSEGGEQIAAPMVCDTCYRSLARLMIPDKSSTLSKIKSFFVEPEDDVMTITRMEHEIIYRGMRLGLSEVTHTALAAETRYPMAAVKDRLQTMGARRYLRYGLTVGGDAVAYGFPETLKYPEPYFKRFCETMELVSNTLQGRPSQSVRDRGGSRRAIDINMRARPATGRLGASRLDASRLDSGRGSIPSPGASELAGKIVARPSERLPKRPDAGRVNALGGLKIVVKNKDDEPAKDESEKQSDSGGPLRISLKATERVRPSARQRAVSQDSAPADSTTKHAAQIDTELPEPTPSRVSVGREPEGRLVDSAETDSLDSVGFVDTADEAVVRLSNSAEPMGSAGETFGSGIEDDIEDDINDDINDDIDVDDLSIRVDVPDSEPPIDISSPSPAAGASIKLVGEEPETGVSGQQRESMDHEEYASENVGSEDHQAQDFEDQPQGWGPQSGEAFGTPVD